MTNKHSIPKFKLFLLGDSQVGKTTFIQRYCSNKFEENISTVGCDIKVKEYFLKDGTKIILHIWDTAGQERFKSLTKSMVKNADGILLLYDITDTNSFSNIINWINDIRNITSDKIKVAIIGNKCDMESDRKITPDRGNKISQKNNALFYETSSKDNINIEEAFDGIITEISNVKEEEINNFKLNIKKYSEKGKCCN